MPYGIIKVDTITFTDGGADKTVSISGLVQNPTFSGNITVTGTISGNVIQGGTTVSGATVTGTVGQFGTLTGNTAGFTTITGATVTGTVAQFTAITGGTAGFTTVTGATVTGTTANFTTLSGTTVTGNTGSFTTVTGGVATITSGVFAVGAEALPSISFASDPNTGIYSPGADQVAISTNGSGRIRIGSTGTVDIVGAGTIGSTQAVSFNGSAPVNSMVLDSSGRLGVGTSSPNNTLHVAGTGSTQALFERTGSNGAFIGLKDGSANNVFLGNTNGVFSIQTPGSSFSDKLVITSAGLVGIGTSSPANLLNVVRSAAGGVVSEIEHTDAATVSAHAILNLKTAATSNADILRLTNGSGLNSVFTASGRLGIGSASPINALTVKTGDDNGIALTRPTNASFAHLLISTTENGADAYTVKYDTSNNDQIFSTAANGGTGGNITFRTGTSGTATEAVRIDSSRRLLVGTSSVIGNNYGGTAGLLQVAKNDYLPIGFFTYNNNVGESGYCPYVELNRARGTQASPTAVDSGDDLGLINFYGHDGSNFIRAATIKSVVDGATGNSDMPGRLVFSTTADGASSPTPRMTITSTGQVRLAGAGITFNGDTATANELDDYEEGTWTPTIIGSTGAGTVTYGTRNARYTKIGRQVFVELYVSWTGGSGGTGNLRVTGLPFTTANATIYPGLSIGYWNAIAFTGSQVVALFGNGDTYIYFYAVPENGGTNTDVPWDSAGDMILAGSYTV